MTTRRGVVGLYGDGRGWTLLAIALGWVFVLGGRFLVPTVLPQVKATFEVSDLEAGMAITVLWAAYALVQSPSGILIDSVGERRLLAGSLLLTGGSVLVIGAAPAFLGFLVGCGVFGVTTGLYGPARGTALSRTFPENDGTAIGATLAAGSVGSAVLPFLAGTLVGTHGWRFVVGGLLVPFVAVGALVWRTVPPREDDGHDGDRVMSRALAAAVLRAVRTRAVAVVGVTVMVFVFQGLSAFLVTYLVSVKTFDQTTAAVTFSLFFVGAAVSQVVSGGLADRFGHRRVLMGVSALNVPALAAVPFVSGVVPLAALSVVLGTRLGIAPVSNAYIISVLPDPVTGSAWGVIRTTLFLLGAGGSTVVGAMADAGLFDESFLLLAALTGVAALLFTLLPTNAPTGA
jgi:predicted MFS family arabinose efflux permease